MIPFPEKRYRALVVDPPWQYLRSGKISGTPVEPGQMTFEEVPA